MDTGDGYCEPIRQQIAQFIPMLATSREAFDYNMCHPNRGLCLILEVENFSRKAPSTRTLERRKGSDVDSDSLIELFKGTLGFEIWHQKDATVSQTKSLLKQAGERDHSNSDCFVCIVLTHGDHGELYAHDGKYPVDLLFRYLLNDVCPTLIGKPKMFFIQACQGNRMDHGVVVREALDNVKYFKIPTHADVLCAFSSVPGFYSFRNTQKGSWFIRALVDVLANYYQEYDLLTMMTIVSNRVALEYCSNSNLQAMSQKKQVPCITSMLTRRVFFLPKSGIEI